MRYYIIDNKGTVYGDYGDRKYAEMRLELLKEDYSTELELEIIEGN